MALVGEIHTLMVGAWNTRDFDSLRDLLHREYSYAAGTGKVLAGGPEVGVKIAKAFAGAFPDGAVQIARILVQGETAIAEMIGRGTHQGELFGLQPSGRTIEVNVCSIVDLRDGKVYRERMYIEGIALLPGLSFAESPAGAKTATAGLP